MFIVNYDAVTGIIHCKADGFLSAAEVQQYSTEMNDIVQRCLREFGSVRMLTIAPETQVQSAEAMEAALLARQALGPDYRIAMVVSSTLAKLQAGRIFTSEQDKAFTSEADALAWLIATRRDTVLRPT